MQAGRTISLGHEFFPIRGVNDGLFNDERAEDEPELAATTSEKD